MATSRTRFTLVVLLLPLSLGSLGCSDDGSEATYSIGGTIAGLTGSGLVLATPGQQDLVIAPGQAAFAFANEVASGTAFAVTASTQPSDPTQACAVVGGSGTVGAADVTTVSVTCSSGAFVATGSLRVARGDFTTTLLSSGKVLVAGGQVASSPRDPWAATATAELYDPAAGTWSDAAPMKVSRKGACAVRLASGRVLVAGGTNPGGGDLDTAEVYDPATGEWADTSGPMSARRSFPACVLLASGEVLVSGGGNTPDVERSADLYDPASGLFTPTGSMATGRFFHSITALTSGKVLVVGGCDVLTCATTTASAERYDRATGLWESAGSLPGGFGVGGHSATLLPSGKVLVAGGCHVGNSSCPNTVDQRHASLYDPGPGAAGSWTDAGVTSSGRVQHVAVVVDSGDVLLAGGDSSNPGAAAELYSPGSGEWTVGPSTANFHGNRAGAARLPGGTWLVVGGLSSDTAAAISFTDRAETFHDTAAWSATGRMVVARAYGATAVLESGKVLLVAGQPRSSAPWETDAVDLYDPATGQWTAAAPLDTPRNNSCPVLLPSGKVLVAGGDRDDHSLDTAELYDPVANVWTASAGSMAVAHGGWAIQCSLPLLGSGKVLVAGGLVGTATASSSTAVAELYDPDADSFTTTGSLLTARYFHTTTLLASGKVLVAGGCLGGWPCTTSTAKAELYDPGSGTWTSTPDMPYPVMTHTATRLPSGKVLIAGGCLRYSGAGSCADGADDKRASLYDPAAGPSGAWSVTGSLTRGRSDHAALLLDSGEVLVVGGGYWSGAGSTTERYDPTTGTWSMGPPTLADHGNGPSVARLPVGRWLVAGGVTTPQPGIYTGAAEILDE
ncbi:MAG TPA: kelch repeat-containing protein [Nocardioides sp.]